MTVAACAALLLGGWPAIGGAVASTADGPGTTAVAVAPLYGAAQVQTDEEEAAEVRTMLALIGALAALTVLVGVLAARGR